MGWLGLKFLLENFQYLPQVFKLSFYLLCCFGWLGWLGCWFFELVAFFTLVVFPVALLFRVGWLGWLGLKFLLENFQFLHKLLSWLVRLLVFDLVVFSI